MVGAGRRKKGGVAGGSSNANPDATANISSQSRPVFEAGGFDGPNDPPASVAGGSRDGGRGRQSSQSARQGGSRPGSQTRGSSQVRGSSRPSESRKEDKIVFNRNVDFGGSVYGVSSTFQYFLLITYSNMRDSLPSNIPFPKAAKSCKQSPFSFPIVFWIHQSFTVLKRFTFRSHHSFYS